jgi:hypothetical protein
LRDPAQPKNRGGGIAHNIFLVSRLEEKKHCANADCRRTGIGRPRLEPLYDLLMGYDTAFPHLGKPLADQRVLFRLACCYSHLLGL